MMKPALAFRQPDLPKTWQSITNGKLIAESIDLELAQWWPKIFGYYMLKVGALSSEISTDKSPIKHQIKISGYQENTHLVAELDDLPIATHSIDVCLLSHVLEFSIDPHHVIREVDRVLIENGYIILTGFNPFSLAGLNKFIPYRRKKSPWNERLFSPMRVKDWLQLMGFEIQQDHRILYASLSTPLSDKSREAKWRKVAAKLLPNLGAVYVLVAKKRVRPLTPIKAKWKIRPQFNPVKIPTMNSSSKI